MRRKETLIYTITDLITKAYAELKSARSAGDRDGERVWMGAIDRLLDIYVEEKQVND